VPAETGEETEMRWTAIEVGRIYEGRGRSGPLWRRVLRIGDPLEWQAAEVHFEDSLGRVGRCSAAAFGTWADRLMPENGGAA
jgi:hypothetical protein